LIAVDQVVWAKPNAEDEDLYRSGHKLLPLFKRGNAINNVPGAKRGRRRTNLWTMPAKASPGSGARRKLQDRPAGKPTAMRADVLMDLPAAARLFLIPSSAPD
jgi:hypothetical protein